MKRDSRRLKFIEIRGFKSIPFKFPLKLEFGDINILLGANGAGKSNIISFFKMVGHMMNGSLQRFIAESGTNQKFLFYGTKNTPEIRASIDFASSNTENIYKFNLSKAIPDRLILTSEEIEIKKSSQEDSLERQLKSDFNESALVRTEIKSEQEIREMLASCKVYQFSDSSTSSPMRQSASADSAHYLQAEANNLPSFLYYLRNNYPESFRRISDYVRDVVPQFNEFYLEPERGYISLKWTDNSPNDYVLTADQLSDGSIRFIALATLLLQPSATMPFVIIIDEPELGLHPYAIDQLSTMIKDASKHAQIVIATQSTALIDDFSVNDVTIIERDESIQGTIAKKLSEENYNDWLEE